MSKKIFFIILIAVLIILGGVFSAVWNISKLTIVTPMIVKKFGIEVLTPKSGKIISSPVKIIGTVYGDGWFGFERQVGTVTLIDDKGNQLARGILATTTEWTKLPTNFETSLEFSVGSAALGSLVFKNENPSGDLKKDKIVVLPIVFK